MVKIIFYLSLSLYQNKCLRAKGSTKSEKNRVPITFSTELKSLPNNISIELKHTDILENS